MKKTLSIFLLLSFLNASIFDFYYIKEANKAYQNKDYIKASKYYGKIDNDEARYDLANSLYKQKKYKQALNLYSSINDKKLEFKKLHNMGNCYANMGKIDEAIKSYEKALKIKEDKDTRYNLELLKKKKKQNQKNNKNNKNKNNKKNSNKTQKNNKNKKQRSHNQQSKNNKDKKEKNQKQTDKKAKKPKRDKKHSKQKPQNKNPKAKKSLSNMEERKWQKMLNQRGINTLMLPLNSKGDTQHETNPW